MTLTCPTTIRHPSSNRTHVWVMRPTLPGAVARWKSVDATAKSRPNVAAWHRASSRIQVTPHRTRFDLAQFTLPAAFALDHLAERYGIV